jgi:NitT/TauT family transport system substrate-binding protein
MIIVITILFVVICLGVYAGFRLKNKNLNAGPPEKITIAYSTASNATLAHIALAKGYFKAEGLDVTPQPHAFGKLALKSVLGGNADMATVADTPFVFAVMNGKKMKVLATIQTANKNEGIVARQDRGIVKLSDFKGKKIGVTLGTTGDFFADSFLLAHGIQRNQVTIVDMKPDEMSAALETGRVDAVSTWNPMLTKMKKELGNKARIFHDETIYTETFNIVAGQDFVKQRPEAIKKVLRALIKAEVFAKQNPAEARRVAAKFIKADQAILDETWDCFNFQVTLDQALLVNFEDQSRWAVKNGWTTRKNIPNYLDFIYIDGLAEVKPDAVRIIR